MDSIISLFHIDWKIIIAQVINFGIVFTVLYIFALKPLAKMMDERSEKIGKGINDAKSNAAILEKTTAEYEKALASARKEANNIFQEGKKEAERERASMLDQAKKEVDSMISNGKKTLEAEKSKMVEEARKEIVSLAMAATEKLISEKSAKDLENI
jgi:F-type H+-transporting ATPase subunit b